MQFFTVQVTGKHKSDCIAAIAEELHTWMEKNPHAHLHHTSEFVFEEVKVYKKAGSPPAPVDTKQQCSVLVFYTPPK